MMGFRNGSAAATIAMRRGPDGTFSARPDLAEVEALARWLDSRFSLFGVRFGVDSMLGLIPGIGDAAGMALSGVIMAHAYRLGARKRTLVRMGLNVAGDTLFGAIPVLGTVVDVMWKANRANIALLKRDLARPDTMRRG